MRCRKDSGISGAAMPNGKPGDHPLTDVIIHGLPVYSPKANGLVREIGRLGGRKEIEEMLLTRYNTFFEPHVAELGRACSQRFATAELSEFRGEL
jgi:hypothetical protein